MESDYTVMVYGEDMNGNSVDILLENMSRVNSEFLVNSILALGIEFGTVHETSGIEIDVSEWTIDYDSEFGGKLVVSWRRNVGR